MTIENYVVIAIGIVAIVCGPLIVRNRKKIFTVISDANRAFNGPLGRMAARRSSTFWVAFCGVGLIFIGVVAVFVGIFARE